MSVRQGRFCDYAPHSGPITTDQDVAYQVTKLSEGQPVKDDGGNPVVYEFDSAKCARNWILEDSKEELSEETSNEVRRRGRQNEAEAVSA